MIGQDTFTVRCTFDERVVATGTRQRITKISMCTVEGDWIVREEAFFYSAPGAPGPGTVTALTPL
ncbi:hypothetical protein HDA32_005611 [Spinactinospora alkalitolerans]|uniref:SnoaL-like domain-containing protein n=1 Tax=Spinactinospora alkalitolerans TaxID=687207 RepID=A0A852U2W1_9ACTN|nr:hypothetical protein [Spinactinospora alkalitolerans]NYE50491.1 hypothetical protein [Spinactinospora alkalitolerans]